MAITSLLCCGYVEFLCTMAHILCASFPFVKVQGHHLRPSTPEAHVCTHCVKAGLAETYRNMIFVVTNLATLK